MSGRRKSAGLTLMDILYVIGAIGLLLAIAVPLVLRSREADRRNSCAVKLKHIATALHTYHDTFQKFPPSAFYKDGRNLGDKDISLKTVPVGLGGQGPNRTPYSFLVKLFPYFQKNDLYDQIDFRSDEAFDAPNFKLAATQVPLFGCPSYQGLTTSMAPDYVPPPGVGRPAITNYKALGATTLACLEDSASVTSPALNGGTLHPYATYSFNTLKAPTQTAVLVETKEEKYAAWWDGSTASVPGFHPGIGNVKDDRLPSPPLGRPALNLPASGNQTSFITTAQFGGREDMKWGPSSDHPGLVNHATGGAEVRAIANEIDPIVYSSLISRRSEDNGEIGGCHGK